MSPAPSPSADHADGLLARWAARGWLRPIDVAFADFLRREAPDAPGLLLLAAALVSHQLGRGHQKLKVVANIGINHLGWCSDCHILAILRLHLLLHVLYNSMQLILRNPCPLHSEWLVGTHWGEQSISLPNQLFSTRLVENHSGVSD